MSYGYPLDIRGAQTITMPNPAVPGYPDPWIKFPSLKWDKLGMDFITGLPRTRSGYDSIWVVVDRLTKVAHFIPVKTTYTSAKLAKIYMTRIVCLHGVPRTIVSDRGTQFTSKFWKQLHETLGTRLEFSTAFHPQTDGQTERESTRFWRTC